MEGRPSDDQKMLFAPTPSRPWLAARKFPKRSAGMPRRINVRKLRGVVCLAVFAAAVTTAEPRLGDILSAIERRYNSLATMQVEFAQTVEHQVRPRIHERGKLSLLRPKKMRWDYIEPAGKLLIGDGETLHMYSPRTNQVRPVKLDDSGDLRAPLSFLLGRLRFRRQFDKLRLETIEGATVVVGEGRSGKDYFERVEFTYDPTAFSLKRLRILGRDGTVTTFAFAQEKINLRLDESLFVLQAPAGAELLEHSERRGQP